MTSDPDYKVRTFSTLNISETTQDRAIVTIERQQEVVCALSNADISNDMNPNPVFKVTAFLKSNISKTVCLRDKVTVEHY